MAQPPAEATAGAAAAQPVHPPAPFLDLLTEPLVGSVLVGHCPSRCLQALRETCRAARAVVDAHVAKATLVCGGGIRADAPTVLMLHRWPRVSSLTVLGTRRNGGGVAALTHGRVQGDGDAVGGESKTGGGQLEAEEGQAPWLRELKSLSFCMDLANAHQALMLSAPWWQQLEEVDLTIERVGHDHWFRELATGAAAALAKATQPRLRRLKLRVYVGESAEAALFKDPWPKLEVLHVDHGQGALSRAVLPTLTELRAGWSCIQHAQEVAPTPPEGTAVVGSSSAGAAANAAAAPGAWVWQLRSLGMRDCCSLAGEDPYTWLAGAAWPRLQRLELDWVETEGAEALAAVQLPALTELVIGRGVDEGTKSCTGDGDWSALATAPWWQQLRSVKLESDVNARLDTLVKVVPEHVQQLELRNYEAEADEDTEEHAIIESLTQRCAAGLQALLIHLTDVLPAEMQAFVKPRWHKLQRLDLHCWTDIDSGWQWLAGGDFPLLETLVLKFLQGNFGSALATALATIRMPRVRSLDWQCGDVVEPAAFGVLAGAACWPALQTFRILLTYDVRAPAEQSADESAAAGTAAPSSSSAEAARWGNPDSRPFNEGDVQAVREALRQRWPAVHVDVQHHPDVYSSSDDDEGGGSGSASDDYDGGGGGSGGSGSDNDDGGGSGSDGPESE